LKTQQIRLFIADDHALVRSGLQQILAIKSDFEVVGEAASGAEVLERVGQLPCDLLLLDLNMPGISGADLIAQVKAHHSHLPILVLSMHNEVQTVTRMLEAGASGFITKNCEPEVLLAAIRTVAAHGNYIDPVIAAKMVFDAPAASPRPLHLTLSERESEIFRLLIAGHSLIAIGAQLYISSKTVSTHKARLMEKLKVGSMADLMRYAMQHQLLDQATQKRAYAI
jgi:DNA-binding NarL/FixJ family response regulator